MIDSFYPFSLPVPSGLLMASSAPIKMKKDDLMINIGLPSNVAEIVLHQQSGTLSDYSQLHHI